jgi:hypothetical protein
MFLRFGFANHGPFRDPVEISFLATNLSDRVHDPIPALPHAKHGILPVVALYGANASGKSNALHAVHRMFQHVADSFTLKPSQRIPRRPHKLDPDQKTLPSRFDCDLLLDGVRYHYGFTCTDEVFDEEWLYAWPEGSKQLWFHRKGIERDTWYYGPGLKGERRRIANQTRDNCLFLSAAAQLNHSQLVPIYKCFEDGGVTGQPDAREVAIWSHSPLFEDNRHDQILALLRAADLGISDFAFKGERETIEAAIKHYKDANETETAESLRRRLEEEGEPKRIILTHEGKEGSRVALDPDEESDGTVSLLNRLHEILVVLSSGMLLIVDELDRSLHPHLCAELIRLFADPSINDRGAQLLFSTHDTSLLAHLRRDEVLLVEKDPSGNASLARMSDFKILKREEMQRVYNEGRVPGVPRLGDFRRAIHKARN